MSGSAVITVNPLPTAYALTGGGGYCTGGTGVLVGVANSQVGVNYQLYLGASTVGAPVAGTAAAISFGLQTAAGTYTVVATNTTTSCVNNMTGSTTITINPLPTVYTVSGGGSYCSGPGVHIFLSNSTVGVNYQLYNGASTVGSPVAGTGAGLDFGGFTVVGTYTVTAANATTGCTSNMTGSGVITGASLPVVYAVTGGGNYCSGGTGVAIGVASSDLGVSYQLFLGATPVGTPVAGTVLAISFGLKTAAGTYTVVGTNVGLSCTSTMSGSATITITSPPTAYAVTGGGSYCSGGTGVAVGLANSDAGINYQLYIGASTVGSPVAGSGAAISFGLQTASGTYTVVATDGATSCTNNMTGSATININPLPTVYAVTGGGSACAGTAGVLVGLANSQVGVSYQLYNGASTSGSAVAGTGAAISFGFRTTSGTYTVVATNSTTTCVNNMSGSAVVTINPLPTDWAFTGGGTFCSGGSVTIGLVNSDAGVNYQLYRTTTSLGTVVVGSAVAGTGSAISFGSQTLAGVYTVIATNTTTGCTRTLSGSTTIAVLFLPAVMPVTGGGSYCIGGTGVNVYLPGSAIGTNYQLYIGGVPTGSPVAGVGALLSFGLQTVPGTYTVVATNATTGCTSNMSGSATVSTNPLPSVFTVTGGGSYCSGGTGVHIQLSSSTTGVSYRLYNGATPVTGYVAGTGTTIDFGAFTAVGTYTANAVNTTTGCTNAMTGSASITILPLPVAGIISGPSTVHDLATITLTETSSGGVWTSSNPGIATVGSSSGIVTGVSAGYTNIFYTIISPCGTVYTIKNIHDLGPEPMQAGGAILGNTDICINNTTTLTGSISGGTWSSGNSGIASINEFTGEVTGNAAGIVAITYTTTDGVNFNMVHTPVVVNEAPDKAVVTAQPGTRIAAGQQLTLKATVANGSPVQSYQWLLNGEIIAGANAAIYKTSTMTDNDVVACSIQGQCGDQPVTGSVKISVSNDNVAQVTTTTATSIFVLPNPNKGTFTIKGTFAYNSDDEATIELTDVLGQVVYKEHVAVKNGEINQRVQPTGDLANGMYLLTLRTNSENKMFHVVIEQ
jgi:Secretion system C-terminal sorting domain